MDILTLTIFFNQTSSVWKYSAFRNDFQQKLLSQFWVWGTVESNIFSTIGCRTMLMVWSNCINHQLHDDHDNLIWFSCSDEVKVNSSKEGELTGRSINGLFNSNINQLIIQEIVQSNHYSIEWPATYYAIERPVNWFVNWKIHEFSHEFIQLIIQFNLLFNCQCQWISQVMGCPAGRVQSTNAARSWNGDMCHVWHAMSMAMCQIQHMTCV